MAADGVSNLKRPIAKLAGLWADAVAMRQAAAAIAVRRGADDDLRFAAAAGHCGEAADEIQRADPDVIQILAVPPHAAQVEHFATAHATEHLVATIATVLHDLDLDLDHPDLGSTDLLVTGRPQHGSGSPTTQPAAASHDQRCSRRRVCGG